MPAAPTPVASLLTEVQQKANLNMEKALHGLSDAAGQAAKLKAVRLSLLAAHVHLQEAVKASSGDSNVDR